LKKDVIFAMAFGIFELVSREHISDVLETLYNYTGLPLQLCGTDGVPLLSFGETARYCTLLQKNIFAPSMCVDMCRKAGERAQKLGEAYIYACHAQLNHIAFPLLNGSELLASIRIGPFLLDQPDSTLVTDAIAKKPVPPALELYEALPQIKVISPERATNLSRLVDHLLSPLLLSERAVLLQTREKLAQQSRINETVQLYKEQQLSTTHDFFYEKETSLLIKVKTGNAREAKALLNELLGYVLFTEGGNMELIRLRAIELTTLLSRIAIEGGARADSIYALNSQFLVFISRQSSFDDISMLLQEVVESFIGTMFSKIDKGNAHIRKALHYISTHYAQPLTVASVAREVGLSPNYFATLFRQKVGESFHTYLLRVRVEEGKQLLLSTRDPLTDIAVALGFTDQSYFCRVFKKLVGMTPGQYRH